MQKHSVTSIAILCSCAILSKYLVILPEYMVKYVGNSAWIDVASKCLLASVSIILILWLYKPFAPVSFKEIFSFSLGKIGSYFSSFFYVTGFTIFNALLLRLLAEALSTVIATTAPDEFFILFILFPVFAAAHSMDSSTINLSCIIFPLVVFTFLTVCIALFPHYRTQNIMPLWGIGTKRLIDGIFTKHFGFAEAILLLFFAPKLGSFKKIKKATLLTFFIITTVSVVFTLAYCLTIPYPASKVFFLPFYQMTRMIKSGAFLQRLEPIVVFVWTSFVMCSMSALISLSAQLLSHNFSSDETKKAFTPMLTLITFLIAMLPISESSAFTIYEKLLNMSTLLFPTVPVILLIIARIRRRNSTA